MKFSILIPTYKEKYLKDCLDSILSQTYVDYEVIIVNDASPYNIESIIKQFCDSRIQYYKNDIGFGALNVVENWNKCLSYASGDYVICMGDDDMLHPKCLELYHNCILSNPEYEVYHVRTEVINDNGNTINIQEARPEEESLYSMLWHKLTNKRIQFIGDFCFKTASLKKRGGFYSLPYACFSDDLSIYMAAKENGIRNINELGFMYRANSLTITNNQNLRETIVGVEIALAHMNTYLERKTESYLDEVHRVLSLNLLPNYASKLYWHCIYNDIKHAPINGFIYWIGKRKKYGIKATKLMITAFKSLAILIKNRIMQ